MTRKSGVRTGAPGGMGSLLRRLQQLEERTGHVLQHRVAVAATSLANINMNLITELIEQHDLAGDLGLWIVDGPESVILPPTSLSTLGGMSERSWIEAGSTFPHVQVAQLGESRAAWLMQDAHHKTVVLAQLAEGRDPEQLT